jgi:hypothetical protein
MVSSNTFIPPINCYFCDFYLSFVALYCISISYSCVTIEMIVNYYLFLCQHKSDFEGFVVLSGGDFIHGTKITYCIYRNCNKLKLQF